MAEDVIPLPDLQRRDAMLKSMALHADSIVNALTGLGGTQDKGMAARPDTGRAPLGFEELDAIWRFNGLGRKIVEKVPAEEVRKGWYIDDGTGENDVMSQFDEDMNIYETMALGRTWGRLYGGAIGWIITREDGDNEPGFLEKPLDLSKVRSIESIVILDRREAWPQEYYRSPRSKHYRQPRIWQIYPSGLSRGHVANRVHASRLIWFRGARLPPSRQWNNGGWDDSILDPLWDKVRNKEQSEQGIAVLMQELSVAVMKLKDYGARQVGEDAEAIELRMRLLTKSRSILGTLLMMEGEEYEIASRSVQGYAELDRILAQSVSAVSDIPQTVLFGDAPSGLNTDGASGTTNWEKSIAASQKTHLKHPLHHIYSIAFAAKEGPTNGVVPEKWKVCFNPLNEPSEQETATLRKTVAETDNIYWSMGAVDANHIARSRFSPTGYSTEMLPVAEEDLEEDEQDAELDAAIEAELANIQPTPEDEGEQDDEDEDASDTREDRVDHYDLISRSKDTVALRRSDRASTSTVIWFPLSEQAAERVQTVRRLVESALGIELEGVDEPHVTALYLGEVDTDEAFADVVNCVSEVAGEYAPLRGWLNGVSAFQPSEGSDMRTPVFLELNRWSVGSSPEALLRKLAHQVRVRQHDAYIPHITLGYLNREMTATERSALMELQFREEEDRVIGLAALEAKRGEERVVFPLTGTRQDSDDETPEDEDTLPPDDDASEEVE